MTLSADILALSPLAYWKLDEASGNFADSSGNGVTLTANGTPVYSQTSLLKDASGTSIAFDGSTDYGVSAANSDVIKATLNVFNSTTIGDDATFFSRYFSAGSRLRFYRWSTNADSLTFSHDASSHVFTHEKTAESYLANGENHIVITSWDGTDLICYIDGIEVGRSAQVTNPYTGSGGSFYLGVYNNATNLFYHQGDLDDSAIFGAHLTKSDAEQLSRGVTNAVSISITESSSITDWTITTNLGKVKNTTITAPVIFSSEPFINITVSPKIDGVWPVSTAIALDYLVIAVDPSATPHLWKCTTAGTTNSTEPSWNLSGTTTDNTVTWTYVDELVQPVTHGPLIPS